MRIIVVDPQKTITCGICKAEDGWIHRVTVRGLHGLYCLKCDTLTVFDPIPSKYIHEAFKKEIGRIRETISLK